MFLKAYNAFRENLLRTHRLRAVVEIGQNGFKSSQAAGALTAMSIISTETPNESTVAGWSLGDLNSPERKATELIDICSTLLPQDSQLNNIDARISMKPVARGTALDKVASSAGGVGTSDSKRFIRYFWEPRSLDPDFELLTRGSVTRDELFGGRNQVILWEEEQGQLFDLVQSVKHLNHNAQNYRRGQEMWGRDGVLVSRMGELPCTLYHGHRYDDNVAAIVPEDRDLVPALDGHTAHLSSMALRSGKLTGHSR